MPLEFKPKQSGAVLMTALAAVFPLTGQAAGAARVDFAVGDVKALMPDGRSRPLARGAEVASGETIDTGSGRAQVRFTDGAQMSLQPQTQFRIDNYEFKGQADGSEKGFFSLLKGGLRTITGLIGRSNRDNYKVGTAVATIGIRGTEYSVAYGNSINVTTGEGVIEVCNAAGCLILNSGETAYVPDANTRPAMSDKKPELPPPPAKEAVSEFSVAEDRTGGGAAASLFPVLASGPGYSMAMAGKFNGSANQYSFSGSTSTSANFDSSSALTRYVSGSGTDTVTAGATTGALSDGIVGWGRWSSGTYVDSGSSGSTYALSNVHYVVGLPTPSADPVWSSGVTASYALLGYTLPTRSTDGLTGTGAVTGSLTVNFATSVVGLSLGVPFNGTNHSFTAGSGSVVNSSTAGFSGSLMGGSGGSFSGFLAGANASRAGLVYGFYDGVGTVSGAATFKRQ